MGCRMAARPTARTVLTRNEWMCLVKGYRNDLIVVVGLMQASLPEFVYLAS